VYARSTTIQAQPQCIDAGIAHIRDEVMPALQEMSGCVGLSLLTDRESGRCIATSAWETIQAMHASADRVLPVRDAAAKAFGGTATVDEWEIAALHRQHRSGEGAYVRATWLQARPGVYEQTLDFYAESVLPVIEEFDGFCSASLMVDRTSRRAVVSTSFDSHEAMERSRDQARSLRTARLRDLGAEQLDVCEFELAVSHLRVPEMA
jgi:hypothetical protein